MIQISSQFSSPLRQRYKFTVPALLPGLLLAFTLLASVGLGAGSAVARDRALLVGIDDYQDDRLDFTIPDASKNDVASIHKILLEVLGYDESDIKILRDANASRENILKTAQEWLVDGTQQGDRVFIYYVGHGYFTRDVSGDEKDGLDETIVPYNARVTLVGGKPVIENMIIDDEIDSLLRRLAGRRVSVVIDSCHSGTVTRSIGQVKTNNPAARTPQFFTLTRSIGVEAVVKKTKQESFAFDLIDMKPFGIDGVQTQAEQQKKPAKPVKTAKKSSAKKGSKKAAKKGSLQVFTAVSPTQLALINTADRTHFHGVFTGLFTEGLQGAADANKNGIVSNAELMAYVAAGSKAYCKAHKNECEMGLSPQLEPDNAFALTVKGDPLAKLVASAKKTTPAPVVEHKPAPVTEHKPVPVAEHKAEPPAEKLTFDLVQDFLVKGNRTHISLFQVPPSPVPVGTRDVRFHITSPHDGFLILLYLTDDGKLTQLFPNNFSRLRNRHGVIKAGSKFMIPDDFYPIRFNATSPSKGKIIAIIAKHKVDWDKVVGARSIEVIPRDQAVQEVLPKIAAALNDPVNQDKTDENTLAGEWSVVTLDYEVVAH